MNLKLLRPDGRSLTDSRPDYSPVRYPLDGAWVSVPGNGAYVANDMEGLLRGGVGPLLVEMECEDPTGAGADGVTPYRRVRVVRWHLITAAEWVRFACACARRALPYVPAGEDRPRLAIEAAEKWVTCPCEQCARKAVEAAKAAEAAEAVAVVVVARAAVVAAARAAAAARMAWAAGVEARVVWAAGVEASVASAAAGEAEERAEAAAGKHSTVKRAEQTAALLQIIGWDDRSPLTNSASGAL